MSINFNVIRNSFETNTFKYLTIIGNTVSIVSILIIFLLYYFRPQLRTYDFRLVIYLLFSDFIWSFSLLLTESAKSNDNVCRLQCFFEVYGGLCSIFWTVVISKSILNSLQGYIITSKQKETHLLLFGFMIPGFIAIMYSIFLNFY